MITLIAAFNEDCVIGVDGKLPWNLPEDLKRFKKTTQNHTVVMGRKTWESLPKKPLPNRLNIVMTKQKEEECDDVIYTSSVGKICKLGYNYSDEIFVIGGGEIYDFFLGLNLVERMLITHVAGDIIGDNYDKNYTYFPDINWSEWTKKLICIYDEFHIGEYLRA